MKYHFPLPSHLPPCRPHALQEFLCFGHSLPSWVKSQLGDAAAPPGGMMGFAVRVPLHFVYGKASRSSRRSLTLLALSGAVPSAPALPQWGRSAGYTLVSLSCSWGRTAISLDVSTFWSMKVKQILVVSEQEHLSCLLQESFWVVGRGHHRLWDTVRNQYPLSQNYCMMLPRAGPLEGREENHIEWKKSHLQIFLKLKIVRICLQKTVCPVMLLSSCEQAVRFCIWRLKLTCWKQELSGNSACLRFNGFSEFPDIILSIWLCLDGGTKHLISSAGSLKAEEEIIRNNKDVWHPAKTDDKSNRPCQRALQGEGTQFKSVEELSSC